MYQRQTSPLWTAALAALLACSALHAQAQSPFVEQFTGTTTGNLWYFYNGACLTAGTNAAAANPGQIPGCLNILSTYYAQQADGDPVLVGGDNGYLGSSNPPAGPGQQQPDSVGNGALRFTNGDPYGHDESGAILSASTFSTAQGVQITFKTVTYRGSTFLTPGVVTQNTGADGISFFLVNGATSLVAYPGVGAYGGSMGYSCSNSNFDTGPRTPGIVRGFDGLSGAYLGIGVDEFGDFLNGSVNTLGMPSTITWGDNTASGGGYLPNTIGLRGAGSVSWPELTAAYGKNPYSSNLPYYPASLASACASGSGAYDPQRGYCAACYTAALQPGGSYDMSSGTCSAGTTLEKLPSFAEAAVQATCANGTLYNYSNPYSPTGAGPANLGNPANTAGILDYPAIAGTQLSSLGAAYPISSVLATTRSQAKAITYSLKITQNNLLSFSFSYDGGAYQPVITDQDLTATIGPVPQTLRFGFAGSTGAATDIHEIICFKAKPVEIASSGAGVNTAENPVINTGTQMFLAYENPDNWTGGLTAQTVSFNTSSNAVTVNATPNWDASCVLTGVNAATGACSTGVASLAPEAASSRTILTWNGSQGIPFEWNSLTPAQQAALDLGDSTPGSTLRLAFLRGDRTNEVNSAGVGLFRTRGGILGDVIDSSPTWVGPPQTYAVTVTWTDQLFPGAKAPESSGQSYAAFQAQQRSRLNVVYVGANDGYLHGFRAGSLDSNGALVNSSATPNDGYEVLAYMPGSILQSASWGSSATATNPTNSLAQNIHGVVASTTSPFVAPYLDFSSPHYGHNYFVDATPAAGDVFWGGVWHTWLVGGLGPGGAAIYALDVTNPGTFTEQSPGPSQTVIGEWTAANLTCVNTNACGFNLGYTYGTPLIRRFHNGSWGVVFGNGYGSPTNAAGIYIMLIDPSSGGKTFYYLATPGLATPGSSGANGISSPASLDLDLDHIVDYIYAGDLQGNIWRFDVTSQNPADWAVSARSPIFNSGQPITTAVVAGTQKTVTTSATYAGLTFNSAPERVVVDFGTGQRIAQTAVASAQYATGTQYLYGIWDWDMTAWNNMSPGQQAVSLTGSQSITTANLQQQTILTNSGTSPATRTVSTNPVCWAGGTNCDPGQQAQFGWYLPLPGSSADTVLVNGRTLPVGEQIIFNPQITTDGELVVNTFIPALDTASICTPAPATGFTMGIEPDTGGQSPVAYFSVDGVAVSGVQNNGTGVPLEITTSATSGMNAEYLLTQTTSGQAATPTLINRHVIIAGQRLSWIQRR
jgi:type IV pilus assembly protein PilY1